LKFLQNRLPHPWQGLEAGGVNKPAHGDLLDQTGEEVQALQGQPGGFCEMGGKGVTDQFHDPLARGDRKDSMAVFGSGGIRVRGFSSFRQIDAGKWLRGFAEHPETIGADKNALLEHVRVAARNA
jgi:hypothetical protein